MTEKAPEYIVFDLPVWLPGNDHNWASTDGVASISSDGDMVIVIKDKKKALSLAELVKKGSIVGLSFSYSISREDK